MVYGNNILPSDAAHYLLSKASIKNGVLSITAGGYARCTLTRAQLNILSENFKVNLIPNKFTDSYSPKVYVHIDVEALEECYSYVLFPTRTANDIYSAEIQFSEAEYETFIFEIVANEDISFSLWELCPQSVGEVEVVIEGVKQSLPKLIYDYNTTEIIVGQSEQNVGMINCYLIRNTDLQGHFLMNFTASERCTVHVRFYDTQMIELFSPLVYTVNEGYGSIEVPHAYLTKLIGVHSFYVTAQATNGYLRVPIRGILYTIDGGYLAERLMSPGMDVSDISIRQVPTDREPSEIWAIGVDSGRVIVKKRVYDLTQPNTAWDAMYVLGEGTLGAIEFNGNWVKRAGDPAFTIETEELPMMAFVDKKGTLWLYQYGDEIEPSQVDINVVCVSMLRGYKSEQFQEHDQGMLLCWVRDGNVYYKQYAYFNGGYVWHPTEQLTFTGDVSFAQAHRLNDYRIGIVTQQNTENIWYITDRTYVAQAVPTEVLRSSMMGLNNLICMSAEEEANISFTATQSAINDAHEPQSDFYVTFDYPVKVDLYAYDAEQWKRYMQVIVNSVELKEDEYEFTIEGPTLHIHLPEAVWGKVEVKWDKIGYIFYLDETRYILNTQSSYAFTWIIQSEIRHAQPTDTLNAAISGAIAFEYIEIQRLQEKPVETLTANLGGSIEFQYIAINELSNDSTDRLTASLDGTMAFAMLLIGDTPI